MADVLLLIAMGLATACWLHDIRLLVQGRISQYDFLIDSFLVALLFTVYLLDFHHGNKIT